MQRMYTLLFAVILFCAPMAHGQTDLVIMSSPSERMIEVIRAWGELSFYLGDFQEAQSATHCVVELLLEREVSVCVFDDTDEQRQILYVTLEEVNVEDYVAIVLMRDGKLAHAESHFSHKQIEHWQVIPGFGEYEVLVDRFYRKSDRISVRFVIEDRSGL